MNEAKTESNKLPQTQSSITGPQQRAQVTELQIGGSGGLNNSRIICVFLFLPAPKLGRPQTCLPHHKLQPHFGNSQGVYWPVSEERKMGLFWLRQGCMARTFVCHILQVLEAPGVCRTHRAQSIISIELVNINCLKITTVVKVFKVLSSI